MKIDLVIGALRSGGAERVVCTLANYFANNGHTVRVITFKDGEKYSLDKRVIRKRFHNDLTLFNYALVRAFFYLFKFYWHKKNRPDVLSAHIGLMGVPTIPICKMYRIKVVVSEHINHKHGTKNFQKKILWNLLYKYVDALTVLTKYDVPFFQNKTKKVLVMYNPSSYKPVTTINANKKNQIVAIGSLDRYLHKGLDNLLLIAKEIKKSHPLWNFQIVGEGNNGRKYLEKQIKHLNLTNTVFLTGFKSNVDEILRESAIFILPSRYEGLPMALLEAASQGTACIAYDCVSGPSDIIENYEDGILVKNQDIDQMILELKNLMEDKQLRRKLGEKAILSIDKFSINNVGKKWIDLFGQILLKK